MREYDVGYATRQLRILAFAGLSVVLVATSGLARNAPVVGPARVVDGDTIVIGDLRVRLEGIDAPETSQTCTASSGASWRCGDAASAFLTRLLGGHDVRCESVGLDKYGRTLGHCFVGALDVNAEMVRQGLAWAFVKYSHAYVEVEAEARALKVGIWQGEAIPAWDYRSGTWQLAASSAPDGCAIKGNVTNQGLIYHPPWSPWYSKINMETAKGKRWFCSEDEAVKAGWRPALRR